MKRVSLLVVFCMLFFVVNTAMASEIWDTDNVVYQAGDVETTEAEQAEGLAVFVITLENGGIIRGVLYPEIAPDSVGNFIALANSGFYDGLIFHRVIPGFMIQGGAYFEEGHRAPGWNIKGEFASNGIANDLAHTRGVISMARAQDPNSAGAQFFIMTTDSPHLNGNYAAFGMVTDGMTYADEIVNAPRNASDKPLEDQKIASIRVETFGAEYPFGRITR